MAQQIPGINVIASVRVCTQSNINLSTGLESGDTIDGVVLAADDRVLVKNQTNAVENGVYNVSTTGPPERAYDAEDGLNIGGITVSVNEGVIRKNTRWVCTNDRPTDVVGVDPLTWQQTAGLGVDGNVISNETTTSVGQIVVFDNTDGYTVKKSAVVVDSSNNIGDINYIQFADTTAPSNPANGEGRLYKKTGNDGIFWKPDAAGPEVDLTEVSVGENNTASNVGSGADIFKQKVAVDLQFRGIAAGSTKVTSAVNGDNIDIDIDETNINHDNLLNYNVNDHIDHTAVNIIAGVALVGGGNIASNVTLDFNIPELTAETIIDPQNDLLALYDSSAAAHRKVTVGNIIKAREYWDAIADPNGSADFTTIAAAFAAGNQTVFARDGTYLETSDIVIPDGGQLIGESLDKVIINFQSAAFSVKIDGNTGTSATAGTISISNGTSNVVGVGTTFTSITTPCFILIEQNYYPVASINSNTSITIGPTFRGCTKSCISYRLQKMISSTILQNMTIVNSISSGLYMRAVRHAVASNIVLRGNAVGINVIACGNTNFDSVISQNNSSDGFLVDDTASCVFNACQSFNSGGHGFHITGDSQDIQINSCQGSNSSLNGIFITDNSRDITVGDSVFNNNSSNGIETNPNTISATIKGCALNFNTFDGIDFDGDNNIVDSCIIGNNGRFGVRTGDNGSVGNSHIFENGSHGIEMNVDSYCQVVGNFIHDNGDDGIWVDEDRNTITGNSIWNNNDYGIDISGGDYNIISSNYIAGNNLGNIRVINNSVGNKITNNSIEGSVRGIDVSSGSINTTIIGNTINGASSDAIRLAANTCTVVSNRCINNAGFGCVISSGATDVTLYSNNFQNNTSGTVSDSGTITASYEPVLANNFDARSATTLQIGPSIATKVEIADNGVDTEVQGTFNAIGNSTLKGLLYPTADGTNGQAVITNGAAVLSFGNVDNKIIDTVTTTTSTTTTLSSFATSTNTTYMLEATVVARRTDAANESAGYILKGTFRNNSGVLVRVGRTRTTIEDVNQWNCDVTTSGTNIIVIVQGQNSKTINWKCSYKVLSV